MTGEIVNLRKARKAQARTQKDAQAAENRVRFGRPKAERTLLDANETLAARRLDHHRMDDPDEKR
jgi:hypothetical protein